MFKAFGILLQLFFHLRRLAEKFKQQALGRLSGIGKSVVNPIAVATIEHHSRVLQIGQMARNVRLRVLQNVLDVAYAQLTVQQQVNDPQPIVVA